MGEDTNTQTEDELFQGTPHGDREWYGRTDDPDEDEDEGNEPEPKPDEGEKGGDTHEPTAEELSKKERDLQKGFEEVARERKRLAELQERLDQSVPAKGKAPDEGDEGEGDDSITPEGRKILRKFVEEEFGGYFGGIEQMYADMVNGELQRFATEKGVDAEELTRIIQERNMAPKDYTLTEARNVYEQAYALHQAQNFDPEALEQKIREKLLTELAEQGVTIEGITPKPKPSGESHEPEIPVYDMTPKERLAHLKQKHPEWDWD